MLPTFNDKVQFRRNIQQAWSMIADSCYCIYCLFASKLINKMQYKKGRQRQVLSILSALRPLIDCSRFCKSLTMQKFISTKVPGLLNDLDLSQFTKMGQKVVTNDSLNRT